MGHAILADDRLMRLRPNPEWSVEGLNSFIGGIMAVCIVLAVGLIILGMITMLPGLVTNNMMERAFSWRRLLASLMIPIVVGAGSSGMAWGMNAFGGTGLSVVGTYQSADGRTYSSDGKVVGQYGGDGKTRGAAHSDSLGELVQQLGKDIASRIADAAKRGLEVLGSALNGIKDKFSQWLNGLQGGSGSSGSSGSGSSGGGFDGGGGGSGAGSSGGR